MHQPNAAVADFMVEAGTMEVSITGSQFIGRRLESVMATIIGQPIDIQRTTLTMHDRSITMAITDTEATVVTDTAGFRFDSKLESLAV